jgi:two-component system, NarL family, response regulator
MAQHKALILFKLNSHAKTAPDNLAPRELEVLRLIAAGNPNKRVASKLNLSEETIKGYVKNILGKLGAHDRTHALTLAITRGIIVLDTPLEG